MEHGHHDDGSKQDLRIALTGLGVALVWLGILTVICYKWALA
ncbi:MAG TPA: hypothetical protein VF263_03265 [Longimicrobiaceae bacterium]